MAQSNSELSTKLASGGAVKPTSFNEVMKQWHDRAAKSIAALCGSDVEANKLYVASVGHIVRSPGLMQCTPQSLQNCIMLSATTKLYPGPYQECAYVPYKGQASFQPMYQGLIKLAIRGQVAKSFSANVVYEKDFFEMEEGTNAYIKHKRFLGADRGQRVGCYALAKLRDEQTTFIFMSEEEVQSIKKRSQAVASGRSSPWDSDEDEMIRKTVIKRLCKLLPKGTEAQELIKAIEIDNANERPDFVKQPMLDVPAEEEMVALPEKTE